LFLIDEAWMQRVHAEPVTMTSTRDERFSNFDELWNARRLLDQRISRWAEVVTDEFTDRPFRFKTPSFPGEFELPGWAVVMHVFNHQTHHRGQLTALLKQLGKDPGATDLPL